MSRWRGEFERVTRRITQAKHVIARDHLSAESGTHSLKRQNSCFGISIRIYLSLFSWHVRACVLPWHKMPLCLSCLTAQDIQIVMKVVLLLSFKRHACSCRMPATEMRQAKHQVKKNIPLPFRRTVRGELGRTGLWPGTLINTPESLTMPAEP